MCWLSLNIRNPKVFQSKIRSSLCLLKRLSFVCLSQYYLLLWCHLSKMLPEEIVYEAIASAGSLNKPMPSGMLKELSIVPRGVAIFC